MQCNDCLNNKNGICFANESMSCAGYEHCLSFEDKSLYMQGAREFAEWLCRKSEYTDIDINGFMTCQCGDSPRDTTIEQALVEWQKGKSNDRRRT